MAVEKVRVEISPLSSFEDNARRFIQASRARELAPEIQDDLIKSMADVVVTLYDQMWRATRQVLKIAGLSIERQEGIRQSILLSAWIEVMESFPYDSVYDIVLEGTDASSH